MISDINILLMFIAFIYMITLFNKKEGFEIDPHKSSGYIPYVPQDIICLILDAAGVKIDRLGVLRDKCQDKPPLKPDDSNICRI